MRTFYSIIILIFITSSKTFAHRDVCRMPSAVIGAHILWASWMDLFGLDRHDYADSDETLTFLCDDATIFGYVQISCLSTGVWSSTPDCSRDTNRNRCRVPDIAYGHVLATYSSLTSAIYADVGETVVYHCDDGSSGQFRCLSGGRWSSQPRCLRPSDSYNRVLTTPSTTLGTTTLTQLFTTLPPQPQPQEGLTTTESGTSKTFVIGVAAGSCLAGMVILGLIILCVVCCIRKRRATAAVVVVKNKPAVVDDPPPFIYNPKPATIAYTDFIIQEEGQSSSTQPMVSPGHLTSFKAGPRVFPRTRANVDSTSRPPSTPPPPYDASSTHF